MIDQHFSDLALLDKKLAQATTLQEVHRLRTHRARIHAEAHVLLRSLDRLRQGWVFVLPPATTQG